jgi:hypothetical protein
LYSISNTLHRLIGERRLSACFIYYKGDTSWLLIGSAHITISLGSTVSEVGQGLVAELIGGVEHVKPATGGGGETFAGFALFRQLSYSTAPMVESVVVPGSAPYEVELKYNNLVTGQIRVHDVLNNVDLTVVGGAPAAGQVQVDYTAGKLTFNAAEAGLEMTVYYRWNLTVAQAEGLFHQAPTNYPDPNYFGQVNVMKGKGRLYTAFYDASLDWSTVAPGTISLGVDGILTVGGGALVPGARVVYAPAIGVAPTASAQLLGIEWLA